MIDYPPLRFARAEIATIADVFPHVALVARRPVLDGSDGGNLLIIGSEEAIPEQELAQELSGRAPELDLETDRSRISTFVDGAPVLTDDYAPVDQLLTPYRGA